MFIVLMKSNVQGRYSRNLKFPLKMCFEFSKCSFIFLFLLIKKHIKKNHIIYLFIYNNESYYLFIYI